MLMDEPFGAVDPIVRAPAAGRVPGDPQAAGEDRALRHPRHRRGDPHGRRRRHHARGAARAVRHARPFACRPGRPFVADFVGADGRCAGSPWCAPPMPSNRAARPTAWNSRPRSRLVTSCQRCSRTGARPRPLSMKTARSAVRSRWRRSGLAAPAVPSPEETSLSLMRRFNAAARIVRAHARDHDVEAASELVCDHRASGSVFPTTTRQAADKLSRFSAF